MILGTLWFPFWPGGCDMSIGFCGLCRHSGYCVIVIIIYLGAPGAIKFTTGQSFSIS